MKPQINIAELLEDCPKGTELYSPLCGKCVFDRLNFGTIICKKQNTQEITFTSKGYYMLPVFDDCECMIFPSKDQRDWSKFVPPYKFKDGDIYYIKDVFGLEFVSIIKKCENNKLYTYVDIGISNNSFYCDASEGLCYCKDIIERRLATEDEKAKLFQEIKDNGYRWSPETKTLDKLPKFKVGDKIVKKNSGCVPFVIMGVSDDYYYSNTESSVEVLPIAEQDNWELVSNIEPKFKVGDRVRNKNYKDYIYNIYDIIDKGYRAKEINADSPILILFGPQEDNYELIPNKFDVSTLKPFESKVLMRNSNAREWVGTIYSHYNNNYFFGCGMMCQQCIPYEGNEHLLGKTDDCDEFYKNWE